MTCTGTLTKGLFIQKKCIDLSIYLSTYLSNSIHKYECIGTINILVQPLNHLPGQGFVTHPGRERIPDKVAYHRAMSSCGAAMMWTLAVHLLATMHLDGSLGCWVGEMGAFFPRCTKIYGANLEKWLFLPCVLIWKHTNWYNQIECVKNVCGKQLSPVSGTRESSKHRNHQVAAETQVTFRLFEKISGPHGPWNGKSLATIVAWAFVGKQVKVLKLWSC